MVARTTRRRLIFGAAVVGLAGALPAAGAEDAALSAMGVELQRLRWWCQRLRKHAHRGEDGEWRRWSLAVDAQTELLERIARSPTHGLDGLVVRVQAVVWELLDDDVVLDEGARRRVAALGRELRRLAKSGNQAGAGHHAGGLFRAE